MICQVFLAKSGGIFIKLDLRAADNKGWRIREAITGKGRFSMVQAVTYQSDKQSVYFQGKLIVLENLTPVLSPEEKKKRKREIENNLYDIFSKYGDRFR